jgi:opacity protein-like surface antigen
MNRVLLPALALIACTLPTEAQLTPDIGPGIRFGVHGNFSLSNFPAPEIEGAEALSDAYGTGWGGGAHLDVRFVGFTLRIQGDYTTYSADEDKFREAYEAVFGGAVSQLGISGGDLRIVTVSANGHLDLLPIIPLVSPYATGGAGLAWITLEEASTSIAGVPGNTFPSSSQNGRALVNAGLGLAINLGMTLYVEGRYVWLYTEGETSTYVPITAGVTL